MADVFTKAKRSQVMARIRGRGNKDTELAMVHIFRAHKITGWRRHLVLSFVIPTEHLIDLSQKKARAIRKFRVRPDFVFPKQKLAIFVDGCFWHGCPLHGTQPKNNAAFWQKKLQGNKVRDRLTTLTLRKNSWRVLRLWEHELLPVNRSKLLRRINRAMVSS